MFLRGSRVVIWITQWLCPQRHCSIGFAWDDTDTTAEEIEKKGEKLFESGAFNRYCGICHGDLHVEHGKTTFKTMEEAAPELAVLQAANLKAREILQNKN
jgi:hypothetical protein